jgi:septum formation protein
MSAQDAGAATGAPPSASEGAWGGGPAGLILGSASPRRRALLAGIGILPHAVVAAEIDETPRPGELPRAYARRMAAEKCAAVLSGLRPAPGEGSFAAAPSAPEGEGAPAPFVLTADTVVSVGRRILGKPSDAAEATRFLLLLSGRRHRVTTAVCLRRGDRAAGRTVETRVRVKRLSDDELSAYLRSGEWQGKAGGYAIQGLFGAFVPEIVGSYTNVVGLPLAETAALLTGMGYRVSYDPPRGASPA